MANEQQDTNAILLQLLQRQQALEEAREARERERDQQQALRDRERDHQQAQLLQTVANLRIAGSRQSAATATPPPVQLKPVPLPKLTTPDSLTPALLKAWRIKWEDHFQTAQLSLQPLQVQQAVLRSALADEWIALWNAGLLELAEDSQPSDIVNALEQYVRKRRNPLLDRHEFHCRDQQTGESVDRYYAQLRTLDDASAHEKDIACPSCSKPMWALCIDDNCEWNNAVELAPLLQEARLRDRLLCGLQNKDLQSKLLAKMQDHQLTTEEIIAKGMAQEHAHTATTRLQNSQVEVLAVKQSTFKKQQAQERHPSASTVPTSPQRRPPTPPPSRDTSSMCLNCGGTHRYRQSCPAMSHFCTTCKLWNHFEEVCFRTHPELKPTGPRGSSSAHHSSRRPPTSNAIQIHTTQAGKDKTLLQINVTCGGFNDDVGFLCDTGSDADIFGYDYFKSMCEKADLLGLFERCSTRLTAAGNTPMKVYGKFYANFTLGDRSYATEVFVVYGVPNPILSKTGCEKLGLIPKHWPHSISHLTPPSVKAISTGKKVSFAPTYTPSSDTQAARDQLLQEFHDVFDDSVLKPMKGPPMRIQLIEGAQPCKRYKAYSIPIHWQKLVKSQLDSMVDKGVIEPVPVGEASDWCHPMVCVPKKGSNEPRITVDLTGLNKFVRRPAYPTRVPREVMARIPPGQKYFTTLDARHGYWQVPLDDDSKRLTTFLTPWGSYRFLRNVMGLISAGDEHNRRGDDAISGIQNVEKIVEDILVYDENFTTHLQRVREILQRCRDHGITLNKKKFHFAQPSTEWCGFTLCEAGHTPALHLVDALQNFPTPVSKTDIRSFHGLIQQFEMYSPALTELALPLRALLPKDAAFVWETPHQRAFEAIKKESPRILTNFTPGQPLRLETDAAQSRGLGFALWQQQKNGTWKLLQASSRAVTSTESHYCATEIELLAVTWAVKKCRLFLLGQPFQLIVDHRPLISIINTKTLDQIENPRLQRLKEKLALYTIEAVWRPGAKHTIVDVFSRFPVRQPGPDDTLDDADPVQVMAVALTDPFDASTMIPDKTMDGVRETANSSPSYQKLLQLVFHSEEDKRHWEDDVAPFYPFREHLTVADGLVFYGTRVVIPHQLRPHILKLLHAAHQGETRMLRRAQHAVFWPGLTNDVKNTVRTCQPCQFHQPSQTKEPLISDPLPTYPFQVVGADLFSYGGYEYLVVVDRYSGWPAVAKTGTSTTAQQVITHLIHLFTDTGIPSVLISDNGPQFAAQEFKEFCQRWGIQHRTSSPHYPQSNGLAEAAVKAIKHLLAKSSPKGDVRSEDFRLGMLEFRNTPRADGFSPAQLVLGAPLRGLIPLHHSHYARCWTQQRQERDHKAATLREKAKERYDQSSHPLPVLDIGDIVYVQNPTTRRWDTIAEIVERITERSYLLRTEAGRVLRRNRIHLRKYFGTRPNQANTEETPPLRRSTRIRRPPRRPGDNDARDPRSLSDGGHDIGLPRTRQQRQRIDRGKADHQPHGQNKREWKETDSIPV